MSRRKAVSLCLASIFVGLAILLYLLVDIYGRAWEIDGTGETYQDKPIDYVLFYLSVGLIFTPIVLAIVLKVFRSIRASRAAA